MPHLTSLDLLGEQLYRRPGGAAAGRRLPCTHSHWQREQPERAWAAHLLGHTTLGAGPSQQRVMDIGDGAFEPARLVHLNLSRNSLTCISDFSLPQLQVLDLSCNSIEAFQTAHGRGPSTNWPGSTYGRTKLLHFPDLSALRDSFT